MAKRSRARCYFGMRNYYFDTHDEDGNLTSDLTEQEWRDRIVEEFSEVDSKELTYIFHDRDYDTEGQKKKLHVHFVVRYDNPRDYNAVLDQFGCHERNLSKARSEASALLYLTHTTTEAIKAKKTRYEVSELHVRAYDDAGQERIYTGEDLEIWYRNKIAGRGGTNKVSTDDGVAKIIDGLADGEIVLADVKDLLREMYQPSVATMTWVKNKRHFKEAVSEYYEEKYLDWLDHGRTFNLIYIEGASGIGKTAFARLLGRRVNAQKGLREILIHNAPNDSKGARYDFLNGYDNEAVTVFDDLNPNTFGYAEFLNLFEKDRVSKYSSRFNDKPWFAEVAIITKSTSIDSWTKKLSYSELNQCQYSDRQNVLFQPRRRFSLVIKMSHDAITLSKYVVTDKKTNEHELKILEKFECENIFDEEFQSLVIESVMKYIGLEEPTDEEVDKVFPEPDKQTVEKLKLLTKNSLQKEDDENVR